MITLYYTKNKCFWVPENFNELSGRQFIKIAPLLFEGGSEVRCKVKALQIISAISAIRFSFLSAEIIHRALPYIAWVFEDKNYTRQLIATYKGYHGPASDFDNLKMKEFHLSELYYKQIISNEMEGGSLDNLVAVLYRRPKPGYDKKRNPDGDIRIDFNHNEIPFHAGKIKCWPLAVKQAIFLWYDACRQHLIDNNPLVFKENLKHSFQSQFDTGLYGMVRNLAGEKLGTIEKVENMYVHTAMLELGLIKEEEKYFEEQLNATN